jgi:hypothetical protein
LAGELKVSALPNRESRRHLFHGAGRQPCIVELMIEKNFGVEKESLPIYSHALDLVVATGNNQ